MIRGKKGGGGEGRAIGKGGWRKRGKNEGREGGRGGASNPASHPSRRSD